MASRALAVSSPTPVSRLDALGLFVVPDVRVDLGITLGNALRRCAQMFEVYGENRTEAFRESLILREDEATVGSTRP